ncbi:cell wall-binding repeat-containing protein [Clostridium scatologenes]|uniref:Putative cell wall binding repeat 2-containing protein n=1 Tax=Clostridium scatologenes TaxID=1548 RepID=A0A0E3JQF3_CLOSL|nr:cell wall-binding repeat-containing protein [Clostridium scatologenes]AKA70842.1 putative cell wall binding repeat 2-containing protein [Clostridium scatologenes]
MNRNSIQAIIMSLVLTAALPATFVKAAGTNVSRIGEADRYATAAKVATTNWSNPKDVILVCGEGYADAVSASVLSKQLDAPIILTNSGELNENAKSALNTLSPKNVYVIGGYASISKNIRSYLSSTSYNVIELSGKNRYETNIAVANQLVKLGMKADNVMLVSGEGFSDALSVAPIAAAKGEILLLGTNNSDEMKSVFNFVNSSNSKVTVIGTSNSINENIYSKLKAVNRINGGNNRFQTNLNVLKEFQSDLKNDKVFIANASSEDGYADALVASSLAGKYSSNLVLVDGENDSATGDAVDFIKSRISDKTDINVIGGTGVISDNVVSRINSTKEVPTKNDPTVQSVTSNGLNQVKVTFNTEVDRDTSELLSNYEMDGKEVNSNLSIKASATLQDDKRTVLITFANPYPQLKTLDFKVKNAILDASQANIIPEYSHKVTFSQSDVPTVKSVTPRGGNKLVIRFSEPIRISKENFNLLKINKQNAQNFSLDKYESKLLDKCDDWADGMELYFDSVLPTGNNTITLPNGNAEQNFDNAAQYPLKSSTISFTIDDTNGGPRVKSAVSNNSDTIYITYDRPMDQRTALLCTNYKINGKTVSVNLSDICFELGSNDTVVKIKNVADLVTKGENKVEMNSNIIDSYGYSLNQGTATFNIGVDNIKPQITSINFVDNSTIRIKFNKSVDNGSATNKSNYKLIDNSTGEDISYKINSISGVSGLNGDNRDTYDLKFLSTQQLDSSKYTITVNNIFDRSSPVNVINTYSQVIEGGNNKTEVTSIVKKSDTSGDVVIFFNKAMDESTLINPENYFFIDGKGEMRKLPANAFVVPAGDDKSVTITFSSSYIIGQGTADNYVVKMGISNVKDQNGNLLDGVAYTSEISSNYNNGPSLIQTTSKLSYEGNTMKVKVSLTDGLDALAIRDFTVDGQIPDSGYIEGKDVVLLFKNMNKINNIRSAGATTTVSVSGGDSTDAAGRRMQVGVDTLLLPPVTNQDSWIAQSAKSNTNYATVSMDFNQDIDTAIKTSYYDDFIFTNETTGKKINVTGVSIENSRKVIFEFNSGDIKSGDNIDVRMNDNINNINIRGKEYGSSRYAVMIPSRDDLAAKTLVAK